MFERNRRFSKPIVAAVLAGLLLAPLSVSIVAHAQRAQDDPRYAPLQALAAAITIVMSPCYSARNALIADVLVNNSAAFQAELENLRSGCTLSFSALPRLRIPQSLNKISATGRLMLEMEVITLSWSDFAHQAQHPSPNESYWLQRYVHNIGALNADVATQVLFIMVALTPTPSNSGNAGSGQASSGSTVIDTRLQEREDWFLRGDPLGCGGQFGCPSREANDNFIQQMQSQDIPGSPAQ